MILFAREDPEVLRLDITGEADTLGGFLTHVDETVVDGIG